MLDPGSRRRRDRSVDLPPRTVRCPVRIASIGSTCTACHRGQTLATIGITTPSAAPLPNEPTWNEVVFIVDVVVGRVEDGEG